MTDEEFAAVEQTAAACGVSTHAFMRVVLLVASGGGNFAHVAMRVVRAVERRKEQVGR